MLDSDGDLAIKGGPNFNHVFVQYFGYYSKLSSIRGLVKDYIIDLRLEVMEIMFGIVTLSCLVFDALTLKIIKNTDLQSCLVVLGDKVGKSGEGSKGLKNVKYPAL